MYKEKHVIFYDNVACEYCSTPRSNYNARIWNSFKIKHWVGFESPAEIIEYAGKFFGMQPSEFVVLCK